MRPGVTTLRCARRDERGKTAAMSDSWAFLRQVVIATPDAARDSATLRSTYRLPIGFTDPMLLEHGVADETIPLGPTRYVELISPANDSSFLHPWLQRVGGAAGYCVAVQVPDIDAIRARATDLGVRVLVDQLALGHKVMQLHRRDFGLILDLDEIADRSVWFWDDVTPGPSPDAIVDDIVEVVVGVTDPQHVATTWATLVDVPQPTPTSVDFGLTIQFVASDSPGLQTVTLQLASGATAVDDQVIAGVTFRHRIASPR